MGYYLRLEEGLMYYLEATNKERLIELCKFSYWDKRRDSRVFFEDACNTLCGMVSPNALHAFYVLANKIDRRNVLFISEGELVECLNWYNSERFNYRSVKKILTELKSKGILTYDIPEKRKGKDNPRRIIFNLKYVWKGDIQYKKIARNVEMSKMLGRY